MFECLGVVFTCVFVPSDTQVDVSCVDFIEQSEDGVTSDDLSVEVVWLEGF